MTVRVWPLALVVSACAAQQTSQPSPPGRSEPITDGSRDAVSRIELCKTTEAELRASFGRSMRDGRVGRHRVQSWVLGHDPDRILVVLLDAHGVVVDLAWDTPGVMTWVPQDACANHPAER